MAESSNSLPQVITIEAEREHSEQIEQLEMIATWMDRRFLDPLLGFFFPGAGGTISSLIGIYGVIVALQMKVHPVVIARMLLNLAIDSLVGGIPILGVIFDVVYRAHVRNLDLIKTRAPTGEAKTSDWVVVLAAAGALLFAILLPLLIAGLLIAWLVSML